MLRQREYATDRTIELSARRPGEPETAADVLPWGISLLAHASLAVLAICIVWSTMSRTSVEEELNTFGEIDTSQTPFDPPDHRQDAARSDPHPAAPRSIARPSGPSLSPLSIDEIGLRGGPSGVGPFDGDQSDDGDGGLFDLRFGNAERVVFVVDATGSLVDSLPIVTAELNRCIGEMRDRTQYGVIFYQSGPHKGYIEAPGADGMRGLYHATVDNKAALTRWMDPASFKVVPGRPARASETLLPALRRAMSLRPQVVYLLSDDVIGQAQFEERQQTLVQTILDMTPRDVAINTIQFLYPDPLISAGLEPTLEQVARKTGGQYRFVSREELGLR